MTSLRRYDDYGNMYNVTSVIAHHAVLKSANRFLLYNEYIIDDKNIISFLVDDNYDTDGYLNNKRFGVILSKHELTEWVMNLIGTDDLFDIDNWVQMKIFYDDFNHKLASLKKVDLDKIQKYKFKFNYYRE